MITVRIYQNIHYIWILYYRAFVLLRVTFSSLTVYYLGSKCQNVCASSVAQSHIPHFTFSRSADVAVETSH